MTSPLNDHLEGPISNPSIPLDSEFATGQPAVGEAPLPPLTTEEIGTAGIAESSYDHTDTVVEGQGPFPSLHITDDDVVSSDIPVLPAPNTDIPENPSPVLLRPTQQEMVTDFYRTTLNGLVDQYIDSAEPPLTNEQEAQLRLAAETDVISPEVSDIYSTLVQQATTLTQTSYGLPATWSIRARDELSWTSVTPGSLPPIEGGPALAVHISNNGIQMLEDYNRIGERLMSQIGELGSDTVPFSDFLKLISEAIRNLRAQLRELQIQDAETQKKSNEAKFSEIGDRQDRMKEMEDKRAEIREQTKKAKKTALAMKILGPILAAVSTIAGILLTVATLGIGSPLGVAMITAGCIVGAAMVAYSIADSVVNVTQKITAAFNKSIENAFPAPPHSEVAQKRIKFLIVGAIAAVMVVILIAMIVAGGGGSIATNVVGQVTRQQVIQAITKGVMEAFKQISVQALMITIMASNVIPEILGEILKSHNIDNKSRQIIEIVTTILIMAILTLILGRVAGGEGTGSAIGSSLKEAGQSIKSAIQNPRAAIDAAAKQLTEATEAIIKKISDMVMSLKPSNIQKELVETLETFKSLFSDKKGTMFAVAGIARASPMVAQAIGGAIQGTIALKVSRLMSELGEIQAEEELLKSLIGMLEKMLASIQSGGRAREKFIDSLSKEIADFYSAASRVISKLSQASVHISSRA